MNIGRNEVNEFHYSSSMPATRQVILQVGTADTNSRVFKVTDLKMTCGSTGRTVKLYVSSYANFGKALEFDLPADTSHDFHWEIPYKMEVVGSTLETRSLVASASGAGVKYSMSGYIE